MRPARNPPRNPRTVAAVKTRMRRSTTPAAGYGPPGAAVTAGAPPPSQAADASAEKSTGVSAGSFGQAASKCRQTAPPLVSTRNSRQESPCTSIRYSAWSRGCHA